MHAESGSHLEQFSNLWVHYQPLLRQVLSGKEQTGRDVSVKCTYSPHRRTENQVMSEGL